MKKSYLICLSLIICVISYTSCTQKQVQVSDVKTQHVSEEVDRLTQFFRVCNSDIKNAVDVIAQHKMIAMLTHLKRMDMEGKKYYLLEREHLTEMIRSVTEGTYSDLILINNKGVIIYTMENDDIFGQHIRYQLKGTVIEECFDKCTNGFYVADMSKFPLITGIPAVFAAFPDKADDFVKGVFIIQINEGIFETLFKKETSIIGMEGKYRVDKDHNNLFTPYQYFDKIDLAKLNNKGKAEFEVQDNRYNCYSFNYNTLSWIVISRE